MENTSTLSLALPPSTPQLGAPGSGGNGSESVKNVPIRTVLAGDSGRTYSVPVNPFSPTGNVLFLLPFHPHLLLN